MLKKMICQNVLAILAICLFSGMGLANNRDPLLDQVELLNIHRHGYVLGGVLTPAQKKTAASNPVEAASEETYKFKDKNLYVVVQKKSHRVVILYEQFEAATQDKIQDLIGDLYLNFDDPTVLAHDKVVYWAWGTEGKISAIEFDTARKDKKKLNILATVKCISDINIMEKTKGLETGYVYYIISSDPVLKRFSDQKA